LKGFTYAWESFYGNVFNKLGVTLDLVDTKGFGVVGGYFGYPF
jgi:hypothetical protein